MILHRYISSQGLEKREAFVEEKVFHRAQTSGGENVFISPQSFFMAVLLLSRPLFYALSEKNGDMCSIFFFTIRRCD